MARNFKNWLDGYLDYTSPLEAPTIFHEWTGISTIAGALRRKVWFDQNFFIWSPNFYIVLVAPPGIAAKSSTADVGKKLLAQIDGVHFGPNALTWQALVKILGKVQEGWPMTDDSLIETEYLNMSCITVVASELGSMLNPHDREMVDILTDLWDSKVGSWAKATATMGSDEIENPWINIIACTTPAWLVGHIPRHMLEAGFFSRIIFINAEKKRKSVSYPGDEVIPEEQVKKEKALVEDLTEIAKLKGRFTLTPQGYGVGKEWYKDHTQRVNDNDPQLAQLGTYVSRRQTHLHKIAMVLSAAKRSDLQINEEDLEEAIKYLNLVEKHMRHIYSLAGSEKNIANANSLVEFTRRHGKVRKNVAFRGLCSRMGWAEFEEAMTDAIRAGRIAFKEGIFTYTDGDD